MTPAERAGLARQVRAGLEAIPAPFPEQAPEQLAALAELVATWGERINLSGHRTPEQVCSRLVLEAAALLAALPELDSLADLGSGAGFPGLPIAVLRPEIEVVLVEARQRRHHFQRAAIRALGLSNARPLLGRIEELPPVACSVALAQAVAPAARVAGLIQGWARPGGWIAIPATADAPLAAFPAELGAVREIHYQAPEGPRYKLWLIKKPS
jgi:16S rRNA (guanine527-N7)-methyltransferase